MCKNAGLLIGWDMASKRALITRANCNLWECPECKIRLRDKWVLRAQMGVREFIGDGLRVDFVTITSHEKLTSFSQTDYVWRIAWGKLYDALKRKAMRLEYMIVPEKHKDGRMHVHALWTAGVTKKWLKDNARKRGLGYMVDVSQVHNANDASKYVTKYIGKDLGGDVPKGFRRVRVSQGWTDIPEPVTEQSGLTWEYLGAQWELDGAVLRCETLHIDMIDAKTGLYWDYEYIDNSKN